jgi:AsmA protein
MVKIMKTIFKIIAGTVLLIVMAVSAILVFLDPNDYKQEIQNVVKQNTGRDLIIDGDIKLSIFPWVGLQLNKVGLTAADGFGHKRMLDMNQMDVRLELLPLLSKEINVAKIVLDGLNVNLKVNKKGVTSWDDLVHPTNKTTDNAKPQPKKEKQTTINKKTSAPTEIPKLVLGGVEFTNANVHYVDLTSATDINLKNFNLIIGQFELGKPFKMSMDFSVENGEPAVTANIAFGGFYTIDLKNEHYIIKNMFLKVDAKGQSIPGGQQQIALDANADINLKKDLVRLQKMTFKVANVVLNGKATIKNAMASPKVNAIVSIDEFNLRETMETLKMALPEMADLTTLTAISANLMLNADLNNAQITGINLQLDQTNLTGELSVKNFLKPEVRYNFVLSEIDVDRYLPPKKEQPEEAPKEEGKTQAPEKDVPIDLPVEMMMGLDIKGHFRAKGFKVMNLKTQQTDIGLLAKSGLITISPLSMNMYQGTMNGKTIIDVRGKKPVYRFATKLDGVEVEPLMNDFMEIDKVQGKILANINIHTTGNSVNQLKAALNGQLNLALKNGAIKGFNLSKELKKAEDAINGKKFDDSETFPKTDFSDVTMSATITNGILKNDDFSLKAPFLRVAGAGTVDLIKSNLDYLVRTIITDKQDGQSGQGVDEMGTFAIPVKISGAFSDIKIKVMLAEALKERAMAEINKALAKEKAKLDAKVKAETAKLKAKVEAETAKLNAKVNAEKAKLKAKEDKLKVELKAKEAKLNAVLKAKEAKLKAELKAKEVKLKADLRAKEAAEKKNIEEELKKKLLKLF